MLQHPSRRILVIEDDDAIRTSVSDWLHDQGYAVHTVATALDGLVSFLTNPPDLVILDIVLPDVSGITVLLLLRSSTLPIARTVPVIVMTAYDDAQLRSELFDHGADNVVRKPFTLAELRAVITRRISTLPATDHADLQSVEIPPAPADQDGFLHTLIQWCAAHYHDPGATIADAARPLAVSTSLLQKRIRLQLNTSFVALLTTIRLSHAKLQLAQGNKRVAEIGAAVGIPNQSRFITLFRKHYGITPKQYALHLAQQRRPGPQINHHELMLVVKGSLPLDADADPYEEAYELDDDDAV